MQIPFDVMEFCLWFDKVDLDLKVCPHVWQGKAKPSMWVSQCFLMLLFDLPGLLQALQTQKSPLFVIILSTALFASS